MAYKQKKFSADGQRMEDFIQSIKTLSNVVDVLKNIGREEEKILNNEGNSQYLSALNKEWIEYLDYAKSVDHSKLKSYYLNIDIRLLNNEELIAYFIMMNSSKASCISRSEYAYDLSSDHHLIISHSNNLENLTKWVKHQGKMEKVFL